jgi:hypothetical protein
MMLTEATETEAAEGTGQHQHGGAETRFLCRSS